jgi:hypothetical protein
MQYGYYSDERIPSFTPPKGYTTNPYGYRCPDWNSVSHDGSNTVVLGCSHTFGEGLHDAEIWVNVLASMVKNRTKFWNLAQPGASADLMIRILYGSKDTFRPGLIIACWPAWSRRERLDVQPVNLTSNDSLLRTENDATDRNNFLKNFFFLEKYAQGIDARTLHCFAEEVYDVPKNLGLQILDTQSLRSCWPEYDQHHLPGAKRELISEPDLAQDGIHYGAKHHQTFARLFYEKFGARIY